jgi:uncharacterized Zn finger protein (UPF0148 family)
MRHDISTINDGEGTLYTSDDINNDRSDEICEKAYKVGSAGLVFCQTCEDLVKEITRESVAQLKQVELALALRTKELAKMKSNLAAQIVEADNAIDKAQTQLRHMEQRADAGSPMQEAVTSMRALVRDLQLNRRNATEDLRNKTLALDIDNSVRKVTAQMACEDVPKKLQTSASAPSMQTAGMRTSGAQPGRSPKQATAPHCGGNPQQGELEPSQSFSKLALSPSSPSHKAGGSSPLKAAANSTFQRSHGY